MSEDGPPLADEGTAAFAEGGCDCGEIRYRLLSPPIVVHCCHCRWCQRETGSAFALNAVIEADRVLLVGGTPQSVLTPSHSERGQDILRCPTCKVAVWSHYAGAGAKVSVVRVGTLDDPDRCPPDVHVYTASRQAWLELPAAGERFEAFYSGKDVVRLYGADGAARWRAVRDG